MKNNVRRDALSGMIWRFAERFGAQGISFMVSIVLARLLDPSDYGLIAIVLIFITLSNVFVDSGLGTALIQKKDTDNLDFSTVFYFNIFLCFLVYFVLFCIAPFIASFYGKDQLCNVIRVLGVVIIISALKNVQQAYVSKHMLFKKFFFSTIGGTIVAALVGIIMAYNGFGVWALVAQQIINTLIDTIILWVIVRWRPIRSFSFQRLKQLVGFGWKLLVSAIINTVYDNLRQLIIGRVYTSEDLAYFNRGKQFPQLIIININSAIDSVLFPVMSSAQDDVQRVKSMMRRSIQISSFIIWPCMMGLAAVAEPFIRLLLTDKWLLVVPFLRIFCIEYAFQPIHTANLNAIKAIGRSEIFLKLEIIKKLVGLAIIFISMHFGVMAMAISMLVYNMIAQIINSWPNRTLLNYGYREQLKDIIPYIFLSLAMAIVVYCISFLRIAPILTLFLQIVIGVIFYVSGAYLLKFESFEYVISMVKSLKK